MFLRILSLLFLILLGILSSCSVFQTKTQTNKSKSVLLITGYGDEHAIYYKSGSKTLLGAALNAGLGKPVKKALKKLTSSSLAGKYTYKYLQDKKSHENIDLNTAYIDLASLSDFHTKSKKLYRHNLNSYKAKGYEYAYILHIHKFGISREFNGIIPISDPRAITELDYLVVDLGNNSILFKKPISIKRKIIGKWEQKPKYKNLMIAVEKAFKEASEIVITE